MTDVEVLVATEGELWPDGKTVLTEGALTWESETLPVTIGFNGLPVGKTTSIRRDGNEIYATVEMRDETFVNRLKLRREDDEWHTAYRISNIERIEGYWQTVTSARLRDVSFLPNGANPRRNEVAKYDPTRSLLP